MRRRQHEIPTHLNVEDKLLFGLTARQFLYVLVGLSVSYALWNQMSDTPLVLRATVVGAVLLATTALTLLRPRGRPLEEWLLAACAYAASPRTATWRPREPGASDWRPASATWHELTPNLTWVDEDDQ
jgi:PrgI family protein